MTAAPMILAGAPVSGSIIPASNSTPIVMPSNASMANNAAGVTTMDPMMNGTTTAKPNVTAAASGPTTMGPVTTAGSGPPVMNAPFAFLFNLHF
uniref:Uncharacterized protein n=1 Tax=Ditylenchus dipsaci TaxID=166011 RepID=A0A915CW85_9BILA